MCMSIEEAQDFLANTTTNTTNIVVPLYGNTPYEGEPVDNAQGYGRNFTFQLVDGQPVITEVDYDGNPITTMGTPEIAEEAATTDAREPVSA